jgi:hypothetical protein
MASRFIYKRCGETLCDEIVRDRCATCGAPIKLPVLRFVADRWIFSVGLLFGGAVLFHVMFY